MAKNGSAPTKKRDNLEAARKIRDILDGFTQEQQQLILRWAGESLGVVQTPPQPPSATPAATPATPLAVAPSSPPASRARRDVAAFVTEKNPQTDIQLAATIAYYYRFEVPEDQQKEEIDANFLRDALRLAQRPGRLVQPLKTLNNAHAKGLLDRGSEPGKFVINSVGENLVGMTLPGAGAPAPRARTARKKAAVGKKAPKRRT